MVIGAEYLESDNVAGVCSIHIIRWLLWRVLFLGIQFVQIFVAPHFSYSSDWSIETIINNESIIPMNRLGIPSVRSIMSSNFFYSAFACKETRGTIICRWQTAKFKIRSEKVPKSTGKGFAMSARNTEERNENDWLKLVHSHIHQNVTTKRTGKT